MGSDITERKPIKAIRDPKKFLKKQTRNLQFPKIPEFPDFPEPPQMDSADDLLAQQAIISRIRRQAIRGGGIRSTIKTSPQGIIGITPIIKKRLTGV